VADPCFYGDGRISDRYERKVWEMHRNKLPRCVLQGFLVFVLCAVSVTGLEAANALGQTGLIEIPTADVVAEGSLMFSCHHIRSNSIVSVGYGAGENIEAGLAAITERRSNGFRFAGGIKVRLIREQRDLPGVAAGLMGQSYYAVISKDLNLQRIRGHLGVGTGDLEGVFVGASKLLNPVTISSGDHETPLPAATVMIEYIGGSINAGLNLRWGQELAFDVGLADLERVYAGGSLMLRF